MLLIILKIILLLILLVGVLLLPVGIPGNFIGAFLILIYYIIEGAETFNFYHFIIVFLFAVSCEILDYFAGVMGARKFGASKLGLVGAFFGAIFGLIIGSSLLPFIGTIAGVFLGLFFGTFIMEIIFVRKNMQDSIKAGFGAMLGRTFAISYKYMVGFGIIIFVFIRFFL